MAVLRLATKVDVSAAGEILEQGRQFQRIQGFRQWSDHYPNEEDVRGDISLGRGYVLEEGGTVAVYLCLDFDGEPAYDTLQGTWGTDGAYGTAHRMAISATFRGRGLAQAAFAAMEEICRTRGVAALRADTHRDNRIMQHILERCGLTYRGIVTYTSGERLAYEKIL